MWEKNILRRKISDKLCVMKEVEWDDWMVRSAGVPPCNIQYVAGQSTESGETEAVCRSSCISRTKKEGIRKEEWRDVR